jgi:hypothetical protein
MSQAPCQAVISYCTLTVQCFCLAALTCGLHAVRAGGGQHLRVDLRAPQRLPQQFFEGHLAHAGALQTFCRYERALAMQTASALYSKVLQL